MSKDWNPSSLFEVFGDSLAREILVVASEQPVSAEAIGNHADASLPTVYRRLDTLTELDMLAERRHVDPDGNQYREFETALQGVTLEIDDGGIDVDIRIRRDISDRFKAFWNELEETSREVDAGRADARDDVRGDSPHG